LNRSGLFQEETLQPIWVEFRAGARSITSEPKSAAMLEIGDLARLLDCSRRSARRRIAEKCSAGSKSASSSSKHWPVSGVISLAQTRPENLPMAAWKARRLEPIALRRDPRAR